MKYMAIIFNDESQYANATPEDIGAIFAAHGEFGEAAGKAGVMLGGDGLQPVATATTVRVRDGERLLTDGPYAETQEVLAGYTIIECDGIDRATEIVARLAAGPNPGGGTSGSGWLRAVSKSARIRARTRCSRATCSSTCFRSYPRRTTSKRGAPGPPTSAVIATPFHWSRIPRRG